ncbi:lipase 3-like isoform X1 [Coccinella septempunctata]|uniref:lipase 3-like isoform X1 n=1 Tax=Coccinella septempunctata TaxID=41139 RepID=UPI001D06A857|nr:lipase 3-like isoform X1 [Coccinella septempunctata]
MWNYFEDVRERIRKNLISVIQENGYPWEEYEVTTEDGYINTMLRIPYSNKNKSNNNERRPPVILCHGMDCCSAVFLNESRLAYFLADQGYDVWLPNNRGTTFSSHVSLDPTKDKEKYWNFSWHEIGFYDIPAFVDFVIKHTGFQKIYYIGHSQGTTAYAVFASERPEYNEKIALSCLLGTAIATDSQIYSYGLLFFLYIFVPFLQFIDRFIFRIHQIPFSALLRTTSTYTGASTLGWYINMLVIFFAAGNANFDQAAKFDLMKFSQTTPNTSSIRQAYHYVQVMRRGRFTKYDYGPEKNLKKYGSIEPPEYNLSKVTSPVALFYGKNDMYNDYRRDKLDEKFANVVYIHVADDEYFNHIDFLIAKDSVSLLYNDMVEIMRKYKAV